MTRLNQSGINWLDSEQLREYKRKHRRKHLEQYRASQRRYAAKHRDQINKRDKKHKTNWRHNNPEKVKAHNLINANPDRHPLGSECEFCGSTEKLEHGHIDYNYPEIYLTVCHTCNCWMDIN